MLSVIETYTSTLDRINKDENGDLSIDKFNRFSKLAELRLIDWLSGDPSNEKAPIPYLSQKNKDWLQRFIAKYPAHVTGGIINIPADFYAYENMYKLGSPLASDCNEDVSDGQKCNQEIEVLDGDAFNIRCRTHIQRLQPKNKPIAKQLGNTFEFAPNDLGSVVLEYIRYPKYGQIVSMKDTTYNDLVPDPAASTNYEWPEFALEPLVFFISDLFFDGTREQAGKQFNSATAKFVREQK